jgi:nicotinamidase-related amidase
VITDLRHGPPGRNSIHLCVDMQRMFGEDTDWHLPWMARVRPVVHRLVERHPDRTVFTRFIPATRAGDGTGTWRRYYQRWQSMTTEQLGPEMLRLVPELEAFTPPAMVVDKSRYSPWYHAKLSALLQERRADTLIVSGGETDVCVIATILGAIDHGYRVIVVTDALCSSSDEAHDAAVRIYHDRFTEQVETVCSETILREWR